MSRYVFVDGRYFEQVCRRWEKLCGIDFYSNIDFNSLRDNAERLFYFDALPNKKDNQTDEAYQKQFRAKLEYLNGIRASEHCHVRDGLTRMREGRTAREQKGVDVLLAVEVLQHSFRGTISEAEIITGDLDFFPVF